jgi:hypothetical protein
MSNSNRIKSRILGSAGTCASGVWGCYSNFTTVAQLPTDAGGLVKLITDPPIYLPWLFLLLFVALLAWAFWPVDEVQRVEVCDAHNEPDKPNGVASSIKVGGGGSYFGSIGNGDSGISSFSVGTINQNNSPNAVGVNLGTINQNPEPELNILNDHGWVEYNGTFKYVVDVKITNPGATSKVRIFAPTDKISSIGFAFEGSGQTGGSGTYENELWSDFMTPASLRQLVLSGEPSGRVPIRAEFP